MKTIEYISITKLKSHEHISSKKVKKVAESIKRTGVIRNPVIVDVNSMVILDGHHRVAALTLLGICKAPVYFVDYKNSNIKVYVRRKDELMNLIKDAVMHRAYVNIPFPIKTTRHIIHAKPRNINIKIQTLQE